jgi:putative flippase GtrA
MEALYQKTFVAGLCLLGLALLFFAAYVIFSSKMYSNKRRKHASKILLILAAAFCLTGCVTLITFLISKMSL